MAKRALQYKLNKVRSLLTARNGIAIALSGGVDSSLLLAIAQHSIPDRCIAVTVHSDITSNDELKQARSIARQLGCKHVVVQMPILENTSFIKNTRNRCYICKQAIFTRIQIIAQQYDYTVAEASNVDDTRDFRPGLKALKELGILSPFLSARIRKNEIRTLARQYHLPTWNRPANACLATRIPYGTRITPELLRRIERAETYLHRLGLELVRVRDHSPIARIEIAPDDFANVIKNHKKIVRYFKRLGFTFTTLDLQGYQPGSLN